MTLGDIPLPPVSSDFDAEFARAADSLETDRREEARALLEELRRKAALIPAWNARVGLFLASDDLRQRDFSGALRNLESAPAAAIGLEPYRLMLFAEALAGAGRLTDASAAWRAAWETDEPFASPLTPRQHVRFGRARRERVHGTDALEAEHPRSPGREVAVRRGAQRSSPSAQAMPPDR